MKQYDVKETAKLIRETLKQAFPTTKFSVRLERYSGGHSIHASWKDGPTEHQVRGILDRFKGTGFDGMTDSTFHCGRRIYKGEPVDFHSGYVTGGRGTSRELMTVIAERVARECGVSAPEINEYGNIVNGHNTRVPYQWHAHWNHDKPLTMGDLLSGRPLLAHDSHEGEWLSTLINRIAQWVSLKAPRPVELPEYIPETEETR